VSTIKNGTALPKLLVV